MRRISAAFMECVALTFALLAGGEAVASSPQGGPSDGLRLLPSGIRLAGGGPPAVSEKSLLVFAAFVHDNWDIFQWDFDPAKAPIEITATPYDEAAPSLSPDHSYCVYETVDGKLWRATLDGSSASEQLPFASDQKFDMHPAVAPGGKQIAMVTSLDRRTDDCDLICFDVRANRFSRRLEMLSYQHYPAWGPDGYHLAFAHLHGRLQTGGPIYEIWAMRTDMPWARQLTLLDSISVSPAWSPDGSTIAFASDRDGQFDIWSVDPVTRRYARLTHDAAADTDPVFSPDGRSIIFVSTRSGYPSLWRLDGRFGRVTAVRPFGADRPVPCKDPDWK